MSVSRSSFRTLIHFANKTACCINANYNIKDSTSTFWFKHWLNSWKLIYEFRNLQWELFYKELGVLHCKQWKKIAIQYIITYLLVNICKKHSCSNTVLFYSNKSHQNTLSEILNLFSFFVFNASNEIYMIFNFKSWRHQCVNLCYAI